jgi:hypothetical protein
MSSAETKEVPPVAVEASAEPSEAKASPAPPNPHDKHFNDALMWLCMWVPCVEALVNDEVKAVVGGRQKCFNDYNLGVVQQVIGFMLTECASQAEKRNLPPPEPAMKDRRPNATEEWLLPPELQERHPKADTVVLDMPELNDNGEVTRECVTDHWARMALTEIESLGKDEAKRTAIVKLAPRLAYLLNLAMGQLMQYMEGGRTGWNAFGVEKAAADQPQGDKAC